LIDFSFSGLPNLLVRSPSCLQLLEKEERFPLLSLLQKLSSHQIQRLEH